MHKNKYLRILLAASIAGLVTALIATVPIKNIQTAPYSVCTTGQIEPDCQRETGTKGLAYRGFPIITHKLFLVNGKWKVFKEYELYGIPTLYINAGIFSILYTAAIAGALKYAHSRH